MTRLRGPSRLQRFARWYFRERFTSLFGQMYLAVLVARLVSLFSGSGIGR